LGLWGSLAILSGLGSKALKKPDDPGSKQKPGFWFAKPDFDEIPGSPILFSYLENPKIYK
jgi:hypothetical protein